MMKAQSSKRIRVLSLYCICTPTEIIFNVPQISQIYTDLILYPEKNLCKSVKSVGLKKSIRGTKK